MYDAMGVPDWLSLAHAMTLTNGVIMPLIDSTTSPDVQCQRGCRQGRVESMRDFCCTLSYHLQPLLCSWRARSLGVSLGNVWLALA
eukprot:6640983-Karenia_brevis.AAC.1